MNNDAAIQIIEMLGKAIAPAALTATFALIAAKMAIDAAARRDLANHRREQIEKIMDLVLEQIDEVSQIELTLRSYLDSPTGRTAGAKAARAKAEIRHLEAYERLVRDPTHARICLMTEMWFGPELHAAALRFEASVLDLRDKLYKELDDEGEDGSIDLETAGSAFLWPAVLEVRKQASIFMKALSDYAEKFAV